jgi:hypothetical protein
MADPEQYLYCVERGKVSAGLQAACGTCHYLLVRQLLSEHHVQVQPADTCLVKENRERELGLDRRETG